MALLRCFACKRLFRTNRSLKRHLSLSKCKKPWNEQLRRKLRPYATHLQDDVAHLFADTADHIVRQAEDALCTSADVDDIIQQAEGPLTLSPPSQSLELTPQPERPAFLRFVECYPTHAAENLGTGKSLFQQRYEEQHDSGKPPWAPFADMEEWSLVKWLVNRVNKTGIEEFLKLPIVSLSIIYIHLPSVPDNFLKTINRMRPSFSSVYHLFKQIDALPTGAKWDYQSVTITGHVLDENGTPLQDDFELWSRDPVECIKQLISNPSFDGHISYVPERVYRDNAGGSRIYDEMWTSDWWWDVQVSPLSHRGYINLMS
jgi:Plavaka transposase